jgi:hypothetical protein
MAATGTTAGPVSQPTVDGTPPGMAARANQTRRPSPAGFDPSFGKSSVEIAGELGRGAKDGIVDLAADAARLDLLHVPAGLARLARSAWSSGGGLGGLVSVVLEPAREQVAAAADRAAEGDFRGAAAAGVKAISVGVTTGIAIGEVGAAAVGAVQDSRPVRNAHLAGQAHPVTGAPFDADGYPDFSQFRHPDVPDVQIELSGSRSTDTSRANAAAGLKETPSGYTWHHHQEQGRLQLVDRKAHAKTGHTGGFSDK